MFKKLFLMLLVSGLLMLGSKAWAVDNASAVNTTVGNAATLKMEKNTCDWTNMKFAEFLGKQYGIAPINGSVEEQYQSLANALSQKGINYFLNTKYDNQLTCCGAADTLYVMAGAKEELGSCDLKINYLIQNGILKLPATGGDPCGVLCNVTDVFSGVEKFQAALSGASPIDPPGKEEEHW